MDKEIRFIDSRYNTLFTIPDGGKITITYSDGEKAERECKYIDDYHAYIGNRCFHICEFAELMERNGNKYEPMDRKYLDPKFAEQNYGSTEKAMHGLKQACGIGKKKHEPER